MQIGLLYPYDEKKLESEIKAGKTVTLGIEMNSLLDQLNIWEAKGEGEPGKVVAALKLTLLELLGKMPDEDKEAKK